MRLKFFLSFLMHKQLNKKLRIEFLLAETWSIFSIHRFTLSIYLLYFFHYFEAWESTAHWKCIAMVSELWTIYSWFHANSSVNIHLNTSTLKSAIADIWFFSLCNCLWSNRFDWLAFFSFFLFFGLKKREEAILQKIARSRYVFNPH